MSVTGTARNSGWREHFRRRDHDHDQMGERTMRQCNSPSENRRLRPNSSSHYQVRAAHMESDGETKRTGAYTRVMQQGRSEEPKRSTNVSRRERRLEERSWKMGSQNCRLSARLPCHKSRILRELVSNYLLPPRRYPKQPLRRLGVELEPRGSFGKLPRMTHRLAISRECPCGILQTSKYVHLVRRYGPI
jgi:hypothetical protein